MNYTQKPVTTSAVKKAVLLLIAGLFTLASMAQDFVKFFSGEWKLNESKSDSITQFPPGIFGGGNRLRSKTMKVVAYPDSLSVELASDSADAALVTRQEKLMLNYKECDAIFVGGPGQKSGAYWSRSGCIAVTSVRSVGKNGGTADIRVTEVWQLGNGANSFFVQISLRSGSIEHTLKLVYDRKEAVDFHF